GSEATGRRPSLPDRGDSRCHLCLRVGEPPKEVLGDDSHQSDVSAATTSRSRVGVTSTAKTTPMRAATAAIAKATSYPRAAGTSVPPIRCALRIAAPTSPPITPPTVRMTVFMPVAEPVLGG